MVASFRALSPLGGWEYELRIGVDACPSTSAELLRMGVDHLASRENVGAYIMRNSLILRRPADCYAIFDADDLMDPGYLATLIPLAMEHGVAAAAKRVIMDGHITEKLRRYAGGQCVFRHDALAMLGGFAPDRISSDLDFVVRARLSGFCVEVVESPMWTYRRLPNSLTGTPGTAVGSACRKGIEARQDLARMTGRLRISPVAAELASVSFEDSATLDASRVSVIVFGPPDGEFYRARNWKWLRPRWERMGWEMVIAAAANPDEPYCKASIAHAGAAAASGDVLVFVDADVLIRETALRRAVAAVTSGRFQWATPNSHIVRLSEPETEDVIDGGLTSAAAPPYRGMDCGGMFVVSRSAWIDSGGFDPRFSGWGYEDSALSLVLAEMGGGWHPVHDEVLWHLWHPEQPSKVPGKMQSANPEKNALVSRYRLAAKNGCALALRCEAESPAAEKAIICIHPSSGASCL